VPLFQARHGAGQVLADWQWEALELAATALINDYHLEMVSEMRPAVNLIAWAASRRKRLPRRVMPTDTWLSQEELQRRLQPLARWWRPGVA